MKSIIPFAAFLWISLCAMGQSPRIGLLSTGTPTTLRGLSVVSDSVVWVSGSNGMTGRSTDGGLTWSWHTVKGFEKTDFRDIEAFDAHTAVVIGVAEPAYILKTTDGGETWKVVYTNAAKGMFLDAMDFADARQGMVIGDPIDGRVFIARTSDGGDSWQEIPAANRPAADSGEAFFAASGSNLRFFNSRDHYLVSGGLRSRLFTPGATASLPIVQGKETTGANSIDVWNAPGGVRRLVIAGGDFLADTASLNNCFYSADGGTTWQAPAVPPHGYRSCVIFITEHKLLTCGLTGVDVSTDGGRHWTMVSQEGFHVCGKARTGTAVFLAGSKGKIAKLTGE
ncbi:MAG: YCF48-related protein [Chitinophagaceae bacterium]